MLLFIWSNYKGNIFIFICFGFVFVCMFMFVLFLCLYRPDNRPNVGSQSLNHDVKSAIKGVIIINQLFIHQYAVYSILLL